MDSSWKNLQIRMEAAWNMRTTPKTKRPKTGDIISSAHSLDWNKKKVRQLQQQWNDEVPNLWLTATKLFRMSWLISSRSSEWI